MENLILHNFLTNILLSSGTSQLSKEPRCTSPRISSSSKNLQPSCTSITHTNSTTVSKQNLNEGLNLKSINDKHTSARHLATESNQNINEDQRTSTTHLTKQSKRNVNEELNFKSDKDRTSTKHLTTESKLHINEGLSLKAIQDHKSETLKIALRDDLRHRSPYHDPRGRRVLLNTGQSDSDENMKVIQESLRRCVCCNRPQISMERVSPRRDSMLVVLACMVLIMLLMLATPMRYFFD